MLTIEQMFKKRVVVAGSSPLATGKVEADVLCGANGGAAILAAHNDGYVDVLGTTSYLFRPGANSIDRATRSVMAGLRAGTVLVDTKDGGLEQAKHGLEVLGIEYDAIFAITPEMREEIVLSASGLPLGKGPCFARVSTGVFLACLAVASCASLVALTGISLGRGHAYTDDNAIRDHVPADEKCLRSLARQGVVSKDSCLVSVGMRVV